ncbi:MAG TPA: hypothetical protein VGL56_09120 [Fimbriimonadaceae bacterium]|jgi:protein-disulfide isomerase
MSKPTHLTESKDWTVSGGFVLQSCAFLACALLILQNTNIFPDLDCGIECTIGRNSLSYFSLLCAVSLFSAARLVVIARASLKKSLNWAVGQAIVAVALLLFFCLTHVLSPLSCLAEILLLGASMVTLLKFPSRLGLVLLACIGSMFIAAFTYQPKAVDPAKFSTRSYEPTLKGSPAAFVVFSDPLCDACRDAERQLELAPKIKLPILYRWKIVPAHGAAAIKIAALIESVLSRNSNIGAKLRKFIFSTETLPTESSLVKEGAVLGLDPSDVKKWLASPEPASLEVIESDSTLADQAGVTALPSLYVYNTAFANAESPSISPVASISGLTSLGLMDHDDYSPLKDLIH